MRCGMDVGGLWTVYRRGFASRCLGGDFALSGGCRWGMGRVGEIYLVVVLRREAKQKVLPAVRTLAACSCSCACTLVPAVRAGPACLLRC